jgi:hypothetical protein
LGTNPHKNPPPTKPKKKQKKQSASSLLIGCMKFLFPKWLVTIFNLDQYPQYKLRVLIFKAYVKTSLLISLCILRDLPKQKKIPRELCGGGDPRIFLPFPYSHEKDFLMGQIRKIQKKQEGKNVKNVGKKKKRSLHTWRFPYSCVLHQLRNTLVRTDPPSGECTHVGTSTTTFNA